ncbi:hypothetical protein Tco_0772225 [Tanacetum coccineum]|uniref:Uncharacterized protein n=1 Tax=Tanacetum coccineum TaxID=301880 RepID=A0ABQ4ZHC0_9ASTR
MVLMVERNCGGHLIRRFTERDNEPDPREVKIASLKQRIHELERRQEKTRSKREWETLNGENLFSYVCDHENHRGGVQKETLFSSLECVDKAPYYPGFHGDHRDNPLLTKETKSEPIIWDKWDEEEEYHFVNKYLSFQEEPIVLVKEESCLVYDTDNEEDAEPAPKYDFDGDELVYEDEEVCLPDVGESLVIKRALNVDVSKTDNDLWLRNNIFRTKCTSKEKVCNMIIDGGSCENMVSTHMVQKLRLKGDDYPEPYQLTWLKKRNAIKGVVVPNSKSGATSAKWSLTPEMPWHQNSVGVVWHQNSGAISFFYYFF